MDRRTFLTTFAFAAAPRMIALEALAAPRMPHTRVIADPGVPGPIFEFRTYLSPAPALRRFGIVPARTTFHRSSTDYVIAFPSLEARQLAWDRLATHTEWLKLPQPQLTHISIYRAHS
jgi:hypothetical protein